jgi:hypothetical protein
VTNVSEAGSKNNQPICAGSNINSLSVLIRSHFAVKYGKMISADKSRKQPQTTSNADDLNLCATQLVALVVEKLSERSRDFKKSPAPGVSATTIAAQQKKFEYIDRLIDQHISYQKSPTQRQPNSTLHRIIRGFIVEFIHQTTEQVTPLNIEHNRNPEAKTYWNSKDSAEFKAAAFPGMYHLAVRYNKLRDPQSRERGNLAKFHAVGEVIRASIDVFKEQFPKLAKINDPRASLYNDHFESIRLAFQLRTLGSPLSYE